MASAVHGLPSKNISTKFPINGLVSFLGCRVPGGPPIFVCDPAFVAEMPSTGRVIMKIGHFDEVGGITYVEI
jgi:hypothetical protein